MNMIEFEYTEPVTFYGTPPPNIEMALFAYYANWGKVAGTILLKYKTAGTGISKVIVPFPPKLPVPVNGTLSAFGDISDNYNSPASHCKVIEDDGKIYFEITSSPFNPTCVFVVFTYQTLDPHKIAGFKLKDDG